MFKSAWMQSVYTTISMVTLSNSLHGFSYIDYAFDRLYELTDLTNTFSLSRMIDWFKIIL